MARSTPKSLAGSAAAVAKKVIGRRTSAAPTKAAVKKTVAKKAPAKKAPATKAPAKKVAAKKAPATKAVAQKAPAKRVPATRAVAKKAPAKKAPATKAPVAKKTPATKAPVAKKTPAKTTAAKKAPVANKTPTKTSATPAAASDSAKRTATKSLASSLVVKEGEKSWTQAELDEVLVELHSQHDKLAHVIEDAEADLAGLMKDAGDGAGHDQADMGATSFERDHELTVVNIERDMMAQIDKALAHIDSGTYGVCESCSEPIGKMRLMAFPRATLCLPCKQREERR